MSETASRVKEFEKITNIATSTTESISALLPYLTIRKIYAQRLLESKEEQSCKELRLLIEECDSHIKEILFL